MTATGLPSSTGSLQSIASLPVGLLVVIGVLAVLELALDVIALVILVRTPRQRVTLPKWAWALLIVFINLIGSILFLTIGRRPAVAVPSAADQARRPSAGAVADSLYGRSVSDNDATSLADRPAEPPTQADGDPVQR